MGLLIIGVLLWIVVHLMPAIAPSLKESLIGGMGANPYRGVFSLLIFSSLALIVFGWRSTPEESRSANRSRWPRRGPRWGSPGRG